MGRSSLIAVLVAVFALMFVGERVLAGAIQCAAAQTCPKG